MTTTIEDLKADLESYVTSVADIEFENAELKRKILFLESDRDVEGKLWLEKLTAAKESWREQALQHGRNQKLRTIQECEKVMQAFQSELRTQQFTHQSKDNSLLLSCLLRAESSAEAAEHEKRVSEAMAFTGATKATVTLQDFDIEDNHISLFNRTDLEVSLIGCCLKFRNSGARFKFPDDTLMMPNSTLSVWYGKEAHCSIRHAKTAGSLYWNSNAAVTTDFSTTVDLVDKKGSVFAMVPANKERYHGADKVGNDSLVQLNGIILPDRHDHFLRFDHFLRLKNDALGEPIMGHQEPLPLPVSVPVKREREEELGSDSSKDSCKAYSSIEPIIMNVPCSARKRPRYSSSSLPTRSSSALTAHTGLTAHTDVVAIVTPKEQETAVKPVPIVQSSILALKSPEKPAYAPISVRNIHALSHSLRPYLTSRNQGSLMLTKVLRRDGFKSAVAVCICNTGDRTVDLSGWRLFAMGNPCQELFLPSDAVVNGNSEVTLVSDTDEDTLLWAQVASNPLVAFDTPSPLIHCVIPPSQSREGLVAMASDGSVGNVLAVVSERRASRGGREEKGESSCYTFDSEVTKGEVGQEKEKEAEKESEMGPQIIVVAGLKSLSKGDVLSLHLIDRTGRNICMMRGESKGELIDGVRMEMLTVFGDSCEEVAVKGKSPFLPIPSIPLMPSIPSMSKMALPSEGCSVM